MEIGIYHVHIPQLCDTEINILGMCYNCVVCVAREIQIIHQIIGRRL